MNEKELFQVALGLLPPWMVDRCTFDPGAGRLDIHLDFPRGGVFPCPLCINKPAQICLNQISA
jgi:hypothetical protein